MPDHCQKEFKLLPVFVCLCSSSCYCLVLLLTVLGEQQKTQRNLHILYSGGNTSGNVTYEWLWIRWTGSQCMWETACTDTLDGDSKDFHLIRHCTIYWDTYLRTTDIVNFKYVFPVNFNCYGMDLELNSSYICWLWYLLLLKAFRGLPGLWKNLAAS